MLSGKSARRRQATVLGILVALGFIITQSRGDVGPISAQSGVLRRVHAPYFKDNHWAEAGIFWFGQVDPPGGPGQNYADVRVVYTAEELRIFVNVEDYYIWYDTSATPASDLTRYETVVVYIDTAHDQATSPQSDDYLFLSGLCLFGGEGSNYQREARGTGGEWDFDWQGAWSDSTPAFWSCNPGPNSNDCGIDFGWTSVISIPWSTLELSGPPPEGTVWGLGVMLYDRDDQPPAGYVAPEYWPETFDADAPSTWGELAFGLATYTPTPAFPQGTTVIRRGLQGSVEDAWVGGGGTCSGGHKGDPERDNHGGDTSLFVENQSLIADFPCFSKSFLRFDLDDIPSGKTIISATLTLHQWSNANPDNARRSLIWLVTVDGNWEEYGLTWNNAPLARENLTATWVNVCTRENPCGFPGVRYDWDATQAVAEASAVGESFNIVLYTADWFFDSAKYFTSSETGDWNAEGRPTLTVVWGEPVATVDKRVRPAALNSGDVVTYTLIVVGSGHALTLTDTLPDGLGDPGPIQVTDGSVAYNAAQRRIEWHGAPDRGQPVTVTFSVTAQISRPVGLVNTATLTDAVVGPSTDTAIVIVNGYRVYLPLVVKGKESQEQDTVPF